MSSCPRRHVATVAAIAAKFASYIFIRQTPLRFFCSVVTTLVREGVKVKVDTWIHTQKQRRILVSKLKIFSCLKFKWKNRVECHSDEALDVVALDAGMKYKELAKRRLDAARKSFEDAAVELRAAEDGMQDAERYFKSLRSHSVGTSRTSDIVFVEHERPNEGCNSMSDIVLVEHARQNERWHHNRKNLLHQEI